MKKVIELSLQFCMPKAPSISNEWKLRVQLAAAYRLSDRFRAIIWLFQAVELSCYSEVLIESIALS